MDVELCKTERREEEVETISSPDDHGECEIAGK